MKKRLFLTGAPGIGKSELIRAALGGALAESGGYFTRRVFDGGRQISSLLMPAAAAAGIEGFECPEFLDLRSDVARKDNEVFRIYASRLLREAEYYPFCVLDEIGGFELVIPQYREALAGFLSSNIPCVGALCTLEAFEAQRALLGLGEHSLRSAERLHTVLENDPQTVLFETTGRGDGRAEELLRHWVREYVG